MSEIVRWLMTEPGAPLQRRVEPTPAPGPGEVLVEVAGCGVCHTDLGFLYDGVRTRAPLPLALGHEIAGFVRAAGDGASHLLGKAVVVPAVLPCGECALCRSGRGNACAKQFMPGNDGHGGFASHVVLPARGLCEVPGCTDADQPLGASGVTLRRLSVLADAASTAWQAVLRSELAEGELAIVVGCGGVGSYAVQLARALGARVLAIDADARRLETARELGAEHTIESQPDRKAVRSEVTAWLKASGVPRFGHKVFECSGHPAGQQLAFELVPSAGTLMVVGYTAEKVPLMLSRLMALDARAIGTWGCVPENYPGLLAKVLDGSVSVAPLCEEYPLSDVQSVLEAVHRHELVKRPVLVPGSAR